MSTAPEAAEPEYQPPAPDADEDIQHSLFGEILDWMLAPLLLLWPMSIAITYLVAKSIANQPFDHALEDSVTVLAQQVRSVDGKLIKSLSGSARDFSHVPEASTCGSEEIGRALSATGVPRTRWADSRSSQPLRSESDRGTL